MTEPRNDCWEILGVWKGCKDDGLSSVLVPVNELLELVPRLTRQWLRSLSPQSQGKRVGGYLDARQGRPRPDTRSKHTRSEAAKELTATAWARRGAARRATGMTSTC